LVIQAIPAYSYATFAQSVVVLAPSTAPADSQLCPALSHFAIRTYATAARSHAIDSIWYAAAPSKSFAALVQAAATLSYFETSA
jgi:hypothetical protein